MKTWTHDDDMLYEELRKRKELAMQSYDAAVERLIDGKLDTDICVAIRKMFRDHGQRITNMLSNFYEPNVVAVPCPPEPTSAPQYVVELDRKHHHTIPVHPMYRPTKVVSIFEASMPDLPGSADLATKITRIFEAGKCTFGELRQMSELQIDAIIDTLNRECDK